MEDKKNSPKIPSDVELEQGEREVLLVRQHWFSFRDPFLIMFFIPFVFLSVVFFLNFSSLTSRIIHLLGQLGIYASVLFFAIGLMAFLWRFYLWSKTYYLVTTKRLILVTQSGLFSHDDRETSLSMIQDVRAKIDGIQPTLYGFGDVIVQVSSEDAQLVLERVGRPKRVQHVIIKEAHLRKDSEQTNTSVS